MKINAEFEDENIQQVRLSDAMENLIAIGNYEVENGEIQPQIVFVN
jgi:hypothetical protein